MTFQKALILSLGLFASPLAAQDSTIISPAQLFAISSQALSDGQAQAVARGADVLLQRDPQDVAALVLRTRAALEMGDYQTATDTAQRGFFAANTDLASFTTARLAARAHAELKQDTRAQLWLRLASQFAPDSDNAEAIARDYQFLRRRNPWSTSLRFGVTPTSNANNGSAKSSTQLFGLPFVFALDGEARALAGYEFSGGFTTTYRLAITDTSATFIDIDANARTYLLSSEAQEQAPDASGSDFSDATVSVGLTHRFIISPGALPSTARFRLGQTWYGGEANTRFVEVSGAHAWAITPSDRVGLTVSFRNTESLLDQDPQKNTTISPSWTHTFASGDSSHLGYTFSRNISDTLDSDFTSNKISADYSFAKPVFGINFGFGLDLEDRQFDGSRFAPGERLDQTVTARIRAVVSDVEYFGFKPVVSLEAKRTESSIDLFDRDYFNVGFDLQSSF